MSSSPKRITKRPRIDKAASQTTSESTTTSPISIHPSAAPSSSSSPHSSVRKMASSLSVPGGSGSTSPVPLRWRDSARPLPHDVLLQIARYLGDMHAEGDHEARLTLASMMRVSNDSFDAAARTLYEFVTVSRDTFAQVFGGNDTKKSKFLDDPITFPTRASVVRKLGLFQYTKRLYIHDLPSEQAVADLVEAWQVSCSRPSSGVSCREALSGSLFPRLECVSFGPGVFLNSYSMPPLGPEFKGGLHRFLSFLRREGSPIHMCLAYPTPAQVSTYQNEHPGAERPGADETAIPADAVVDPATPGPPLHNPNSLSRADEASWPDALARAWSLETITVHNVRFGRAISTNLVKLPCRRLRIFALESVCGLGVCDDKHCVHCDSRWGRAGSTLQAMARAATEDKDAHSFETLEIANVGAGYALACTCVTEYANAVAYLKGCLCDRTEEAPWTLELPHASEAAACRCCGATVSPIGDTGEGSSRRGIAFNTACLDTHRWEKGFRPTEPFVNPVAGAAVAPVPAPLNPTGPAFNMFVPTTYPIYQQQLTNPTASAPIPAASVPQAAPLTTQDWVNAYMSYTGAEIPDAVESDYESDDDFSESPSGSPP